MRGFRLSVAGAVVVALASIFWLMRSRHAAVQETSSDQRAATLPRTAASDRVAVAASARSKPGLVKIDAPQHAQLAAAIAAARTARERLQKPSAADHAPPASAPEPGRPEKVTSRERIRAHIREVQPLL